VYASCHEQKFNLRSCSYDHSTKSMTENVRQVILLFSSKAGKSAQPSLMINM
jgi:hypothetical protein